MQTRAASRHTRIGYVLAMLAVALVASACSPGSLPGSPSPIASGGGGGRYSGTLTYRRLGGQLIVSEAAQSLSMNLALSTTDQFAAQFETAGASVSRGTLQGLLTGTLNDGSFRATVLVSTPATSGGTSLICEGRGEATGTFAGRNVTWTLGTITYESSCAALVTSAAAQATAVSPFPGSASRANIVVAILEGSAIQAGTCKTGQAGFPFTVEVREINGIEVTLDSTIRIEERRGSQAPSVQRVETPFTTLRGGERRTYAVCVPRAGTYQAFFSGRDANGNVLRFSSPLVRLGA